MTRIINKMNDLRSHQNSTQQKKSFNFNFDANLTVDLYFYRLQKFATSFSIFDVFRRNLFANFGGKKRFRKSNIGYFDSHYSKIFDKNDFIVIGDKIYYRNV